MTPKLQPRPLSVLIYQPRARQHHTWDIAHKKSTTVPEGATEEEPWES